MPNHKKIYMIVPGARSDGTDLHLNKTEAQTLEVFGDYFTYASIACKLKCKERSIRTAMEFLRKAFGCSKDRFIQKQAYNHSILIVTDKITYLNEKFIVKEAE